MGEIHNTPFDSRQCIAKDLDKTIASQIQEGHLAAAQKLFTDCINTRALNTSVQEQVADKEAGENARDWKRKALSGQDATASADTQTGGKDQPQKEHERDGGLAAVIGMWHAPQLISQATDELKNQVRDNLTRANFPHPEYVNMLDGVKIEE